MTPEEFKELVKSKGTQADVAAAVGLAKVTVEKLCRGERRVLRRHVIAVQGLKKKVVKK